jgi:hypothetical protein
LEKQLSFLSPTTDKQENSDANNSDEEPASFFGLPLGDEEDSKPKTSVVAAKTFRIVGVLKDPARDGRPGPSRGLMPSADVYIPLQAARQWSLDHLGEQGRVLMALARESGAISEDQSPGYFSAVVRVNDPVALPEVRKRLKELGLGSFSSSISSIKFAPCF